MTETMTTKGAPASVRKTLGMLASHGRISNSKGDVIEIPSGLGFTVRATAKGVNITIEDRGWADRVTGGDRAKIADHRQQRDEIHAEVDKVRGMFSPALPGKTEWGLILISARATGVTHMSSRRKAVIAAATR